MWRKNYSTESEGVILPQMCHQGCAESVMVFENPSFMCLVDVPFLLLAHGYGCQDFESMYCKDLLDRSGSVYRNI